MNINKTIKTAGGCWWDVTSWGWTTRGPTLPAVQRDPTFAKLNTEECDGFIADGVGSALSASQRLFIRAMRYLEENEDQIVIEALKLPKEYTGKQINAQTEITTEIQWLENLHQLLDVLEKETIKSFADNHISALFSYVFTSVSLEGRKKPPTNEENHGP